MYWKERLDADLNLLINEVSNGEGFMARKAIGSRIGKFKAAAMHIMLPVYQDAAKWNEHQKNCHCDNGCNCSK